MAVVKDKVFVAPSTDIKTLEELDSLVIESGIFYCGEERDILGVTSDRWTVICLSNETQVGLRCYSQIWIPSHNNFNLPNRRLFIRTSGLTGSGYSDYSTFVSSATDSVVDMYFGGDEPEPERGITKVWYNLE